jgi:hypothetical protein
MLFQATQLDGYYWGTRISMGLLAIRLLALQYREFRHSPMKWRLRLGALVTWSAAVVLCLLASAEWLVPVVVKALADTRQWIVVAGQGLSSREVALWIILAAMGVGKFVRVSGRGKSLVSEPGSANSPTTTVIVQPSPAVNIAGLEAINTAVQRVLAPLHSRTTSESPLIDCIRELKDILEKTVATNNAILERITAVANNVDSIPKINTLATSILEMVDVVQEEGAATRQIIRDNLEAQQTDLRHTSIEPMARTDSDSGSEDDKDEKPIVAIARGSFGLSRDQKGKNSKYSNKDLARRSNMKITPADPMQQEELVKELRPQPPVLMTKEDVEKFIGKPQQEVAFEINRRERERREGARLPYYLTESEIELARASLAVLDRQWRMKAGLKIRAIDFIEIGNLTEEQLKLPRHLIRQLIRTRRTENFVERMREEGRETIRCGKCQRLYPADTTHNCFVAGGWSSNILREGVPATKEMVITQTGRGGIQIKQQIGLDAKRLNENYKKLSEYKMVLPNPDKLDNLEKNSGSDKSAENPNPIESMITEEATAVEPAIILTTGVTDETRIKDSKSGRFFRVVPC